MDRIFAPDIRSTILNYIVISIVSVVVLIVLWLQNKKRYSGTGFWIASLSLETCGMVLIILRTIVPDWASIILSNTLIMTGLLFSLIGFERFVGKPGSHYINALIISFYTLLQIWFTFNHNDLTVRRLIFASAFLLLSAQNVWLIMYRTNGQMRKMLKGAAWIYTAFCVVNLLRIIKFFVDKQPATDFFQNNNGEALIIIIYQLLNILLVFALVLVFNKRVLADISLQEEKYLKAFQSSPYGILYTRLADGKIIEANKGFMKISGYTETELLGKTTKDIRFWEDDNARLDFVEELKQKSVIFEREQRFRRKSGEIIHGLVSSEIIVLNNEKHLLSSINDITERKKAETVLYQRLDLQDQLAKIADTVPGMIFSFRMMPDGSFSMPFCTPVIKDLWGFMPEELKEDFSPAFDRILSEDSEMVKERITESARTLNTWNSTFRVLHPERGELWLEGCSIPRLEKDGSVIWHGFVQDVTDSKKVQIAMQESEQRYRDLVQNANSSIIRWGRDGSILFFNEYSQKLFGYTSDEALGQNIGILVPEKDSAGRDLTSMVQDILDHPLNYINLVNENICRDGRRIWMAWTNKAIVDESGTVKEILAVGIDISKRKKAEEDLQASREDLKVALESMTDAVFISDTEGNFLDFNEAFATFHKFRDKDECAKTLAEYPGFLDVFMSTGEPAKFENWAVPRALRGEIGTNVIYKLRRRDTAEEWIGSYSFAPIRDNEGKIRGSVVVGRDITEKQLIEEKLRESEEAYRTLIEVSMDAIFVNRGGRITYINSSGLKLFGADSIGQIVGRSPYEFFHPDYHELIRQRISRMLEDQLPADMIEEKIVQLNGTIVDVEITATPFMFQGDHSIQVILRDISGRKKAEEAIMLLNEDLEKRVIERTSQLENAMQELEAFSYSVSHDLRAPLRAINGYAKILAEDYQQSLDEEGRRFCSRIESNAVHMSQLIDDLLAFSRVGRTELSRSDIDMTLLVNTVYNEFTSEPGIGKIKFIAEDLPPAFGDATTIKQVISNLLSNAIKYSSRVEHPVIEAGYRRENDAIIYYIKDNGIGFDMKYFNKLFGVFQRLHNSEEFEGNGVGLAIVQRVINRHGGHIWAESIQGEGATFYFTLPALK